MKTCFNKRRQKERKLARYLPFLGNLPYQMLHGKVIFRRSLTNNTTFEKLKRKLPTLY